MQKRKKSFFQMSPAERAVAVEKYDRPLPQSAFQPASRKHRLLWDKARASKPDVSISVHDDRTDVVIHLDANLLAEARKFAKKNKTSLPKMIDRGLRGLLAFGS